MSLTPPRPTQQPAMSSAVVVTSAPPVSGTVTSGQGAPTTPANSWPVEVTDGTNVLGTSAHPLRTDPTGTTTQPISGTVTANAGTNLNTSALALETGGNLASVATHQTDGTQKTQVTSLPALPTGSNTIGNVNVNGTVPVSGTFWQATQPVSMVDGTASGTLSAASSFAAITVSTMSSSVPGANTFVALALTGQGAAFFTFIGNSMSAGNIRMEGTADGTNWFTLSGETPWNAGIVSSIIVSAYVRLNCAGLQQVRARAINTASFSNGNFTVAIEASFAKPPETNITSWFGSTSPTVGQKAAASSVPVVIASDNTVAVTASAGTNLNTSALALESGGNLATLVTNQAQTAETLAATAVRGSNTLPATALQLQRVKLAMGDYGQDLGDVGQGNPLHARDYEQRRFSEEQLLRSVDSCSLASTQRGSERYSLVDRRGNTGRGTVR